MIRKATPYVWQRPEWPNITFESAALAGALAGARLEQGKVVGALRAIGLAESVGVERELWTEEAMSTAAIEGEKLDLDTVRSSVMRRLGEEGADRRANRHVEGLLDLMQDATASWQQRLDVDRLHGWHSALFPAGRSGMRRIAVGRYRESSEPMQIVSGAIGKEKIHYEAPATRDVPREMERFLGWWERTRRGSASSIDGLLRAGIAHLWFETIHPFEDGNGRLGRALIDLALAQDIESPQRYCSVSRQLMAHRGAYYDALNGAQRGSTNVTEWLAFFLEQLRLANEAAKVAVDAAVQRSRFWTAHAAHPINARQRKVLQRLLDAGNGGFEGGMSTDKYANLAQTSKPTASRDLVDLRDKGLVVSSGQGKATRYWVNVPGWKVAP